MHNEAESWLKPRVGGAKAALLMTTLVSAVLTGCVHCRAQPLAAAKVAADFESRSPADAGLKAFLESNRLAGEWLRRGCKSDTDACDFPATPG